MTCEKKKKLDFLRRWLCVAVMLAMIITMAACGTSDGGRSGSKDGSSTTVPQKPEPKPIDLVYELTQADVDEFYALLEECETLSIVGEDLDAIDAASEALEESFTFLDAQYSIANILHYSHMEDETLEQQYLDCVEICTQANDAYLQMVRRVYLSDTPAKDYLFEDWTEKDIADLLAYDEQVAQLQQRNAEIGVEYRTTNNDARKIELYIELVGNNNAIAEVYGYDNYYTYAYQDVYGRDYDADAVSQLRQYAKTYLGEIYYTALINFYYSFYENLSVKNQNALSAFLYNDYNTLDTDYVRLYLDALSGTQGDTIATMLEKDSYFTNAQDAMPGAFTTTIGERCYCFFGPGYGSSMTVVHEGGHYYAGQYADLVNLPLDLAETHSQGNEWLFASFLKNQMPAAQHTALVDYLLYENVSMIMVCLMVDEFEQIVYSTDLTGFTAADFDAIMDEISLQYFPDGDVEDMLTDMNGYWRQVVVEQPVYYVSYAVSAIAAMSLYTAAEEDFDSALAVYQKLCQEPVLEEGFLGNILSAGLSSPFDESFYQQLQQMIQGRA